MDWSGWSHGAAALMRDRSKALLSPLGERYEWDLDAARFTAGEKAFRLVVVGTVTEETFLWSWSNDSIPAAAKQGIDAVREFGVRNGLTLLVQEASPGGLAQGKECLAIAGRVLDAEGCFVDELREGSFVLLLLFTVQ